MTEIDFSAFPPYTKYRPAVPAAIVTPGGGRVMHRFFDTSPISPSGRYIALLRLPHEDRRSAPGDAAEVIVIDLQTGAERQIGPSRAWEHQIGACVQWGADDTELCYNDLEPGEWKPFLVRCNPQTGVLERFPGGAFMISPDAKFAVGYDLTRVRRFGFYGYGAAVPEPFMGKVNGPFPDDDGIYLTDLTRGERRLLMSIGELMRRTMTAAERAELSDAGSYGFQTKWSPDGTRLLFAVCQKTAAGLRRMVFSLRADGSEPNLALPWRDWDKGGHHFNWHPDGENVTMNLKMEHAYLRLMQFPATGGAPRLLAGALYGSGHPSVSPDGLRLVTDSYGGEPTAYADGTVPIRLIDLRDNTERELVRIRTDVGADRSFELRCDPHPAWDRTGRYITVNSFEGGTRRVLVLDTAR